MNNQDQPSSAQPTTSGVGVPSSGSTTINITPTPPSTESQTVPTPVPTPSISLPTPPSPQVSAAATEIPVAAVQPVVTPKVELPTSPTVTTQSETQIQTPPVLPPLQTPETQTGELVSMPPKKTVSPIVLGVAVFALLMAAGTGTYFVSRSISSQQSVAPTAPESEPMAFEPTEAITEEATSSAEQAETLIQEAGSGFDPNEEADCSGTPNTAPYGNLCLPVIVDDEGQLMWAPETGL